MIAGNISRIITGKFPKAYRKPEEVDMSSGKQKTAVPVAVNSLVKNQKIFYVHHALINSTGTAMAKPDPKNELKNKPRKGEKKWQI